jgi:hypothetical protein
MLIFSLCIFPTLLFARNVSDIMVDSFEETAGRGLLIRTDPTGVRVFINGVDRGLTPVSIDNLSPGEHNVRLVREGYRERRFNITLFENSRLTASIVMEEVRGLALVSINRVEGSPQTLPFNPQLYSPETTAAVPLSHDNRTILNLPAGYHTVRVRAFGWEDATANILIEEHITASVDIFMRPAAFRIANGSQSRRRFNPNNSSNLGITDYRFEVSAHGFGSFTILNRNGSVVFSRQFSQFDTWVQHVTWNGRDSYGNPLPEGIYTVIIEGSPLEGNYAGQTGSTQILMETEIDYSLNIFPLSLAGGIPGLSFTPVPNVLPAGCYQIEASISYGRFFLQENITDENENTYTGFPFGIGFRLSPINRLETSVVFNMNPRADNTGWGITGSVKYNILNLPLALSAGVFYAWAGENGENPLSPGRGIGIHAPLSWNWQMLSFIFSPGIFWHGPEGITPAPLLSAGVLYQGNWLNAGFSMRYEAGFKEGSGSRFLAGAEGRFFPPPSNFFFSLQAGFWTQGSNTGGHGGLGIGIIY